MLIDEQLAEIFDEGATGTRRTALERHQKRSASLKIALSACPICFHVMDSREMANHRCDDAIGKELDLQAA